MISLVYILSFLLNGKLDWLQDVDRNDPNSVRKVGHIKKNLQVKTICVNRAACLVPFVTEVMNLKFDEKPEYTKLKFKLMSALLARNQLMDNHYEWSKWKVLKP